MTRLQLTGTNPERILQIKAEANKTTEELEIIKKSNLDKQLKATITADKEQYLETLREQYKTIRAIQKKQILELQQQATKEAEETEANKKLAEAKQLNLYKLSTMIPRGMYEELPDKHKAIVSQFTTKYNTTGYSIDLSKLTGTIKLDKEYTCKELYEFLTAKHPLFSYTNWCYLTPDYKIAAYDAYAAIIKETGLVEDIEVYKSLHSKVED